MLLSFEEMNMLEALAKADGVTASDVLRMYVRREYRRRFSDRRPTPQAPTFRGLIEDVAGRAHYFAGNIAERMGVPLENLIEDGYDVLVNAQIFKRNARRDALATWESRYSTVKETLEKAEANGINLDERFA